MTVNVSKPAINVREKLAELDKPTGIAGEAMLRAETPQEQFNLIGAGRRNLIINGAMQVAQRGTSVTSQQEGTDTFVVDRWFSRVSLTSATVTMDVSQEVDAPEGFRYSFKTEINGSQSSLSSGDQFKTEHRIEGQNLIGAGFGTSTPKYITLSFWFKSSVAGKTCVAFVNNGNDMSYVAPFNVNSAATWEYKTVTLIAPDNTATWVTDNGIGLRIRFGTFGSALQTSTTGKWISGQYMSTSDSIDYTKADGSYWQITGVQLELGKVATPFEHRSFGEELALCQRYYYKGGVIGGRTGVSAGYTSSSTSVRWTFVTPSNMRATPTYSAGSNPYAADNGTNREVSSVSVLGATQNTISMIGTIAGSGSHRSLTINYGSSQNFKLDAEL